MDSLPKLIANISPESIPPNTIKCGRKKAAKYVTTIVGPFAVRKISEIIRSNFYSIIINEKTDIRTQKCLLIVVRYYDHKIENFDDIVRELYGSGNIPSNQTTLLQSQRSLQKHCWFSN